MAPSKAKAGAKGKPSVKINAPANTKKRAPVKGKGKARVVVEEDSDSDSEPETLTRITMDFLKLVVFVDDGVGSHSLEISTMDNYNMLVTKISSKMGKPVHCVSLGYEAPWSSKAGQKKRPIYLISEDCLDHFWVTSKRHIDTKVAAKKRRSQVVAELGAAIIFINMSEAAPVSHTFRLSSLYSSLCRPRQSKWDVLAIKYRTTRRPKAWE